MHPVDGFVDISQALANMIKSLANEPSLGLFYVQQHTHKAVPNLVNLTNNILTKSRQITLHTQDSEDSITIARSIKDCGFPIVDDMIKDITKSLAIITTKQPKRAAFTTSLSSVFKSPKLKANTMQMTPSGNQDKDMLLHDLISSENFDEFKAVKEARFEEWLSASDTHSYQ